MILGYSKNSLIYGSICQDLGFWIGLFNTDGREEILEAPFHIINQNFLGPFPFLNREEFSSWVKKQGQFITPRWFFFSEYSIPLFGENGKFHQGNPFPGIHPPEEFFFRQNLFKAGETLIDFPSIEQAQHFLKWYLDPGSFRQKESSIETTRGGSFFSSASGYCLLNTQKLPPTQNQKGFFSEDSLFSPEKLVRGGAGLPYKITCNGQFQVNGDLEGISIQAGSLFVNGEIRDCQIQCRSHILVARGVRNSEIKAMGSIRIGGNLHEVKLEGETGVYLIGSLLDCKIQTSGFLFLEGQPISKRGTQNSMTLTSPKKLEHELFTLSQKTIQLKQFQDQAILLLDPIQKKSFSDWTHQEKEFYQEKQFDVELAMAQRETLDADSFRMLGKTRFFRNHRMVYSKYGFRSVQLHLEEGPYHKWVQPLKNLPLFLFCENSWVPDWLESDISQIFPPKPFKNSSLRGDYNI